LENEEKEKKQLLEKLKKEEEILSRAHKDAILADNIGFDKRKEKLREELKASKAELKEKQGLLRKQEKHMKEQHEILVSLEDKCRKYQSLIYEHKACIEYDKIKYKTEEDVIKLKERLQEVENKYEEEKRRCKQLITNHGNTIKNLNYELDTLTLELKEKDQITRVNYLKINELKRLIRASKKPRNEVKRVEDVAVNVDGLKKVIMVEKNIQCDGLKESGSNQIIEEERSPISVVELRKNFNDGIMQAMPTNDIEDITNRSNVFQKSIFYRKKAQV
jgi:chromosome segregation ATPase